MSKRRSTDGSDMPPEFAYLEYFKRITSEEKNPLAKMILQENYITLQLKTLILSMDFLTLASFCNSKKYFEEFDLDVAYSKKKRIPVGLTDLQGKTLGNLLQIIKEKNFSMIIGADRLVGIIRKYIKDRNNVTHNIMKGLLTKEEIQKKATKICVTGEDILNKISWFIKKMLDINIKISTDYHKNNKIE